MFKVPEQFRVTGGPMGSHAGYGNNGVFQIPFKPKRSKRQKKGMKPTKAILNVICSDGMSWEHVSVSTPTVTPSWRQMCFIKDLFWSVDDCVLQFHPPHDDYINNHDHCLHLWRPTYQDFPRPDSIMVGIK